MRLRGCGAPHVGQSPAPHLEVDDGGGQQDADALQQVPHHMHKGGTNAGAARQGGTGQAAPLQLLIAPHAVPVALVQDVGHAVGRRSLSTGAVGHIWGWGWMEGTYTRLAPTAQAEVASMVRASIS